MTAQTPAERRNPKTEDSRMIITDTTTPEADDTISRALQRAYLAGFNAAGEGYNGEYPFSDSGRCPSSDEDWITGRDMVIEKLIAALPSPQNGESELRTDGPERIWAWEGDGQDGWENAYATVSHVSKGQVEYIRADLAHEAVNGAATPAPVEAGLIEALRSGEQADMDGCRVKVSREACEKAADILSALQPGDGWLGIESAKLDRSQMIVAVPDQHRTGWIVGEAYYDPEAKDWFWAGTSANDYFGGPISELNHWLPELWQPMPEPSAPPAALPLGEETR